MNTTLAGDENGRLSRKNKAFYSACRTWYKVYVPGCRREPFTSATGGVRNLSHEKTCYGLSYKVLQGRMERMYGCYMVKMAACCRNPMVRPVVDVEKFLAQNKNFLECRNFSTS